MYFYILVDPYSVLCKLLAVRHQHVGKVLIFDTPFEIVFNNGNYIFYALCLVEPLILTDAGAMPFTEIQKIGFDFVVVRIHGIVVYFF